ncbi:MULTISPECIES: hypothetical protein [Citromicrobium]|mgnify:CR=1 FL=1|uniref:hypothetical protein n=1 Tax=Citromicrobium TaxID=72173 RepID=UPI0001DD10DC|nr:MULTISPECIES: hypothetical protein [Citromicrobium]ALG60884.1 hypothetical protein WG74_08595 [Citromicrobium sp. JL477]MAY77804.1 hypothetical protein [Citromicrobium sp.]|tara:strand:- start:3446 stop:3670 length:225 start_codon:yes stop_codon:yes gene_type:complete
MSRALVVVERDRAPTLADRIQRGARGYAASYLPGELNRCPSCGCKQWHVGRVTATCSRCDLPLAIAADGRGGAN